MSLLKKRGQTWNELTNSQVQEIREQIKNIENDPSYTLYRFCKTSFGKWVILNSFVVPMKLKKSVWV